MSHRDLYRDHDEEEKEMRKDGPTGRFREFDCPSCNAYNPTEEFGDRAELLCNYCGTTFLAKVGEEGKLRLREI